MKSKQIRKFASEIYKLERIHRNPASSEEEIKQAERRIIELTDMISCLPGGFGIMMEINDILYRILYQQIKNKGKKQS